MRKRICQRCGQNFQPNGLAVRCWWHMAVSGSGLLHLYVTKLSYFSQSFSFCVSEISQSGFRSLVGLAVSMTWPVPNLFDNNACIKSIFWSFIHNHFRLVAPKPKTTANDNKINIYCMTATTCHCHLMLENITLTINVKAHQISSKVENI